MALSDKSARIFLNAKRRIGEEAEDVRAFLDYVNSLTPTDGFAAEVAAAVERIKSNAEERKRYMRLAMDIQAHIEKEKENWRTEFLAEDKAKERRDIALRMLKRGASVEQVAEDTGLTVEEVQGLCIKQ